VVRDLIIRINGQELALDHAPALVCSGMKIPPPTNRFREWISAALEAVRRTMAGMLMAGAVIPASGLEGRLWPLISRMQDFGLFIGIGFGLWGVYMIMVGNPEGKNKLIQALVGFIGLYIVPEAFMSIRDAFRG